MNARILKIVQIPLLLGLAALFSGCHKPQESSTSSGGAGAAIVPAEKTSFDQVTSKLDKGGSFYLYASTAEVLGNLSKNVGSWSNFMSALPASAAGGNKDNIARGFNVLSSLIADSGIEQINGFGASSIAREPGFYYSKAVLYHEEGQNDGVIWSVFGKESHSLKELDLLPENTAFATYADFDFALVWKTLQKELAELHLPDVDQNLARIPAQIKGQLGFSLDDLFDSLGGGYGLIFTADETKKSQHSHPRVSHGNSRTRPRHLYQGKIGPDFRPGGPGSKQFSARRHAFQVGKRRGEKPHGDDPDSVAS